MWLVREGRGLKNLTRLVVSEGAEVSAVSLKKWFWYYRWLQTHLWKWKRDVLRSFILNGKQNVIVPCKTCLTDGFSSFMLTKVMTWSFLQCCSLHSQMDDLQENSFSHTGSPSLTELLKDWAPSNLEADKLLEPSNHSRVQGALSCWKRTLTLGNTVVMKGCTWSGTMLR